MFSFSHWRLNLQRHQFVRDCLVFLPQSPGLSYFRPKSRQVGFASFFFPFRGHPRRSPQQLCLFSRRFRNRFRAALRGFSTNRGPACHMVPGTSRTLPSTLFSATALVNASGPLWVFLVFRLVLLAFFATHALFSSFYNDGRAS